ncbi:type II secretion system protein [Vibrio sp. SCSIO 43137]|uniref:type II secretion system protein n=1 Tax=Vibrio sp. SCSIO 43137 TaxID=3021011 RepID=UPI002306FC99|nr:type II secretion system protein [Vibrio sp. SCSIO 43137]WCE30009.1 type II secretion system protein [Vibrio sp. SCSIO 43137]
MAAKLTYRQKGFTLIESIVAIVVMGVAMVTLTSLLFPQFQDSAKPQYEVRAAALANSLLTEVMARRYDENSNPDGEVVRCGEGDPCTLQSAFGPDGTESDPASFDDVDDYIGCWTTNTASNAYCSTVAGNLDDVFGDAISSEYPNFAADIDVVSATIAGNSQFKKVTVTVTAGSYGEYQFSAYRGNY